jgi:hypothetical protein
MSVCAVGDGKTSAYTDPSVDQLLASRAWSAGEKIGGLFLKVH